MPDAFVTAEEYLRDNPDLLNAMRLLSVSQEQYARAQQALSPTTVLVTNSSQPGAVDEELARNP